MNIWDKLLKVNVKDKDYFKKEFYNYIEEIKKDDFILKIGEIENKNYYIITEENRMNSYFIHIVPKQIYILFKEMQKKTPNQFLGYTVLVKQYNNKDLRISCFGVECHKLSKFD